MKLAHAYSYWSCQTSATDVRTRWDSISSTFTFNKCSGQNGAGWSKQIGVNHEPANWNVIDGGYTDAYRGWYDPLGGGVCNQVSEHSVHVCACRCA